MLKLSDVSITHFRNYDIVPFSFTERVVGICGPNGIGKTNLLDVIYYCCFTKSYFSPSDAQNIGFGKEGFRLQSKFLKYSEEKNVTCIHRGQKKEFFLNEVPYEKLSNHIGLLPAVMVAPDDIEFVNGGSELRRKYIDTIICELDQEYLQKLIIYNKLLQQRNSLLKQYNVAGGFDEELLHVIDEQMDAPADYVYKKRLLYFEEIKPLAEKFYSLISKGKENLEVKYQSGLHEEHFSEILLRNREKDRFTQRTNGGIHKDDIRFGFNGQAFKTIASQGQKKSLLFAMKLAEFDTIKKHKGFAPILLLDDVFEKLDGDRMQELLRWVCKENDGQVFITDTHRDRLEQTLRQLETSFQIVELS